MGHEFRADRNDALFIGTKAFFQVHRASGVCPTSEQPFAIPVRPQQVESGGCLREVQRPLNKAKFAFTSEDSFPSATILGHWPSTTKNNTSQTPLR
jgi:hypothetical protein